MKKIFGLILAIAMVCPLVLHAVTADDEEINLNDYNTLNFKEILEEEDIKLNYEDYKETEDQITIYLFRGNGCGHCRKFLNFLNDIAKDYGKYFKVVGFEVWSDEKNYNLLSEISNFLGEDSGGVPYIIIGDQVIPGFAEAYGDQIKSVIKALYDSKERYDVFEAYNDAISDAKYEEYAKTVRPIIFNAIFVCIATFVICFYVKKQNQELLSRFDSQIKTQRVVKEDSVKVEKMVKKPTSGKRK